MTGWAEVVDQRFVEAGAMILASRHQCPHLVVRVEVKEAGGSTTPEFQRNEAVKDKTEKT